MTSVTDSIILRCLFRPFVALKELYKRKKAPLAPASWVLPAKKAYKISDKKEKKNRNAYTICSTIWIVRIEKVNWAGLIFTHKGGRKWFQQLHPVTCTLLYISKTPFPVTHASHTLPGYTGYQNIVLKIYHFVSRKRVSSSFALVYTLFNLLLAVADRTSTLPHKKSLLTITLYKT